MVDGARSRFVPDGATLADGSMVSDAGGAGGLGEAAGDAEGTKAAGAAEVETASLPNWLAPDVA